MSDTPRRARSARSRVLGRVLADVAATLATLAAAFLPVDFGGLRMLSPWAIALLIAAIVAMLLRRRAPRISLLVTVVLTAAAILVGGAIASHLITVFFTVFTVGRLTDRRSTIIAASGTILAIWTTSIIVLALQITDLRAALLIVASIGFAAAAGDASRSRRAYIDEITARARLAEETKEGEARRRVADERVAIARDLHDLVAHQIAVVSLNAGVASRALPDRPDDAQRALAVIRGAAHTVLQEISGLLTVLRAAGDGDSAQRLAPSPGLAQLPELIAEFEASGLAIRRRTEGEPVELPPAVDAVAYRALHEALTNVVKHGGAADAHPVSVLVYVEYRGDDVELTVTNPVPPAAGRPRSAAPGGHGLSGVRERVASVHGRLDAGHGPGPVYRFTVRLPVAEVPPLPPAAASGIRLDARPDVRPDLRVDAGARPDAPRVRNTP